MGVSDELETFIRSLPDVNYIEVIEQLPADEEREIRFVVKVGDNKIDYVLLMNDTQHVGTAVEIVIGEVISSQV